MIFAMSMIFILLGGLFLISDFFFPVLDINQLAVVYSLTFPLRLMGIMFVIIGCIVLTVRSYPQLTMYMDLPSSKIVPCIHSRIRGKDPDAKNLKMKRVDLEVLRTKNKVIKDTGGGFRILGHSCRRTYETIGFTVPDYISSYFHEVKEQYKIKNSDEWRALREGLLKLSPDRVEKRTITIDGKQQVITHKMTKEEQLRDIQLNGKSLLEEALNDPVTKTDLLEMSWKQLRRMELLLFDGISHNGEEVELFIDSATPNEQDILERQTFLNEMERHNRYKDPGEIDLGKYMWPIIVILLIGTVCAIMLQGVFGS